MPNIIRTHLRLLRRCEDDLEYTQLYLKGKPGGAADALADIDWSLIMLRRAMRALGIDPKGERPKGYKSKRWHRRRTS